MELSTAERVSERGIGFDGRTRERTGNFCWDPSWRGEDGVRLRNATSFFDVEPRANLRNLREDFRAQDKPSNLSKCIKAKVW
jgi:hypothetical protein